MRPGTLFRLPRQTQSAWSLFLCLSLVLSVLFPLLLTQVSASSIGRPEVAIYLLVLAYAGARLAWWFARASPSLFDLTFWIFTYVFLGLSSVAQVTADRYPLGNVYPRTTQLIGALIVAVGIGSYEVGRLRRRQGSTLPLITRRVSVTRSLVLGLVATVLGVYVVLRIGIGPFFNSRDSVTAAFLGVSPSGVQFHTVQNKASGTLFQAAANLLPLIALLAVLSIKRTSKRSQLWGVPVLVVLVALNLLVNNPISNARYWFATVLFAVITVWLPWRRPAVLRIILIGFVVSTLFALDYLDAFRRPDTIDLQSEPVSDRLLTHPDYGPFQQLLDVVAYVDGNGHTHGAQLAGAALVWFPREFWDSKPEATTRLVSPELGHAGAVPLWGEFYIDFGWPGLVFGMYLWGNLTGLLDTAVRKAPERRRGRPGLETWVPAMAAFQILILRGSLQPTVGILIPLILLILFATPATKRLQVLRTRSTSSRGARWLKTQPSERRRGFATPLESLVRGK